MSRVVDALIAKAQSTSPAEVVQACVGCYNPAPPHIGEDWGAFLAALETVVYDDARDVPGVLQGEPGSIERLISIYGKHGAEPDAVFCQFRGYREHERRQREQAALLASTTEVVPWSGTKFGKPKRIPTEELSAWLKPGAHVVIERPDLRGRNFDADMGPSFSIRTAAIGQDREDGRVVAKRIVRTGSGMEVQYQVKPRSKAAEAEYQRCREVAALRSQLTDGADYLTLDSAQEIHDRLGRLLAGGACPRDTGE